MQIVIIGLLILVVQRIFRLRPRSVRTRPKSGDNVCEARISPRFFMKEVASLTVTRTRCSTFGHGPPELLAVYLIGLRKACRRSETEHPGYNGRRSPASIFPFR
jgi:hypothetical protein